MLFHGSAHTLNHPDTIAFMRVLRRTIDTFDDRERFLIGETNAPIQKARAHCGDQADGLNLVFLFKTLAMPLEAEPVREVIGTLNGAFQDPLLPTWVFSNHDRERRIGRLGNHRKKAALNIALQLTVRGVPFFYYGEEIGMEPEVIPLKTARDTLAMRFKWIPQILYDAIRFLTKESLDRDESRTPMQWNREPHAGFCPPEVAPWLPVGKHFQTICVAQQEKDPASLLNCFKRFATARRTTPALSSGDLQLIDPKDTGRDVVGFLRTTTVDRGLQRAVVFLNCSPHARKVRHPAREATALVSTEIDDPVVQGDCLRLRPWEGLVLLEGHTEQSCPSLPVK